MHTPVTELLGIRYPLVWAGQSVGLIDDLPACAELIRGMVSECRAALERSSQWVADRELPAGR